MFPFQILLSLCQNRFSCLYTGSLHFQLFWRSRTHRTQLSSLTASFFWRDYFSIIALDGIDWCDFLCNSCFNLHHIGFVSLLFPDWGHSIFFGNDEKLITISRLVGTYSSVGVVAESFIGVLAVRVRWIHHLVEQYMTGFDLVRVRFVNSSTIKLRWVCAKKDVVDARLTPFILFPAPEKPSSLLSGRYHSSCHFCVTPSVHSNSI